MRIILIGLYTLIASSFYSQTPLVYASGEKEDFFRKYAYADGSFSLYTAQSSATGLNTDVNFLTYSPAGELLIEKQIKDVFGISSSANAKLVIGGLFRFIDLIPEFVDNESKKIIKIGASKDILHCRTLDHNGEIHDIKHVLGKRGFKTLTIIGAVITAPNQVTAIYQFSDGYLYKVLFDLKKLSCKADLIDNHEENKLIRYTFVGAIGVDLFCLRQDGKARESYLMKISSQNGICEKLGSTELSYSNGISPIPFLNQQPKEELFFCVQGSGYHIYKFSIENGLEMRKFFLPKGFRQLTLDYPPQFPVFSIYKENGIEKLVYSATGSQVVSFEFDSKSFEIAEKFENHYSNISLDLPIDVIPFVQSEFPQLSLLLEENEKNSASSFPELFKVGTLINPDGSFNFLVITGDKVEGKQYYQNVKILKY